MMRTTLCMASAVLLFMGRATAIEPETLKEWQRDDARIVVNTPGDFDGGKPTLLIIYLPPNGNTIEMTAGAAMTPGMDWHYDIQHIAAQMRKLRQIDRDRNIVLAYLQAKGLSWPAWRNSKGSDNGKIIRVLVDEVSRAVPGPESIALAAHSGGGSFIFGLLNGAESIPENIERIAWIDANYAYDDNDRHGDKLLAWLKGDAKRHLVVIAYNDRKATLNGKPLVSETGGTFYRSRRMIDRFRKHVELIETRRGPFEEFVGMNGQIHFLLHTNEEARILHTVLVERNGLLEAMTWNTPLHDKWDGEFWGAQAYSDLIVPLAAKAQASGGSTTAPKTLPARASNAIGGRLFAETIADLPPKARESAIVAEVVKGNIPQFLREFEKIEVKSGSRTCTFDVMRDYLAIGSDDDFVRMPMTPASAMQIADALGCTLPTRKMVNDIYTAAKVKLEPRPLTQEREAVRTFVRHDDIIEAQRAGNPLDVLVAGHKKDVVISNKLKEKPNKVAIYGWHKLDGKPIQPLYAGHVDWYVDYSHGIRLIRRECVVDGKTMTIEQVLKDPSLCDLLSDEGVIDASY